MKFYEKNTLCTHERIFTCIYMLHLQPYQYIYIHKPPAYILVYHSCINQFGIFNLLCWIQQMKNILILEIVMNMHTGGVVGAPMIYINKLGRMTEFLNNFIKTL